MDGWNNLEGKSIEGVSHSRSKTGCLILRKSIESRCKLCSRSMCKTKQCANQCHWLLHIIYMYTFPALYIFIYNHDYIIFFNVYLPYGPWLMNKHIIFYIELKTKTKSMPNSINMYIVYVGVVKKRLHLCFQQYCPEVDKTIHVILPFSFHFRVI